MVEGAVESVSELPNQYSAINTHPKMMQASSARRRACSQALRASSASTVPPYLPSGPVLEAVSQVLTTKLVLASNGYGCAEEKELCSALSRVVVET